MVMLRRRFRSWKSSWRCTNGPQIRLNPSSFWMRSRFTLHAEVRPPRPTSPGHIATRGSEYGCRGTTTLFCAVEPKAGTILGPPRTARLTGSQWLYPNSRCATKKSTRFISVMNNLITHCHQSLVGLFGKEFGGVLWERPTLQLVAQAWHRLKQAEIEISLFAREC